MQEKKDQHVLDYAINDKTSYMMRYWGDNFMNNGGWCGGSSGGFFGSFWSLFFWAAVILGIIFLVRWMANQGKHNAPGEDASMRILRERYAKGEITKEEFEARKKDLVL